VFAHTHTHTHTHRERREEESEREKGTVKNAQQHTTEKENKN
jgi:hypothetical protein